MHTINVCGIFVFDENGHVLSVRQHYERLGAYHRTLPGGGIDEGETLEQAATRELREETRLHALGVPEYLFEVTVRMPHVTLNVYGLKYDATDGDILITEDDITEIAFLSIEQAREVMAQIDDIPRIEPIIHVFDCMEKSGKLKFFRWDYTLDVDGNILTRRELQLAG